MNRAQPSSALDTLPPIWINAQCRNWLLQRIASELTNELGLIEVRKGRWNGRLIILS